MKKIIYLCVIAAVVLFTARPYLAAAEDQVTPTPVAEPTVTPDVTPAATPEATPTLTPNPEIAPEPVPATTSDPTLTPTSEPIPEATPSATTDLVSESVGTKFTEIAGTPAGTTASPVIKAMWEMQGLAAALSGTDDNAAAGAQFLPSGQYQVSKPIALCAVVSDPSGVADIDSVSSDVYYPQVSFGADITDGTTAGCGPQKITHHQMTQLTKEQGLALFCDTIQAKNPNLPGFYDISDFEGICSGEGDLQQETAAVFCSDGNLKYDDPSGEYKVSAAAKDKEGASSNVLSGTFSYLELTAFETDFTNLNYGNAALNATKTVEGDLVWQEPKAENHSTVRNVGNTRLQMEITQDDMGLGKTNGDWNIRYGTKVGADSLWQNYWPEEPVLLDTVLDLAGMEPMDFAITVLRFPEDGTNNYSGKMTLNAQKVEPLVCEAAQ